MFDSLVLGNSIELLDGGVASVNPLCPGAIFRLQPGADPGAPQPTTDFVAGLLLDGERPFGRRASNRTIKLPVWIQAPNRQILAAAREYLQQVVDQDYFTITWTRDPYAGNPGNSPQPLLLDCFRAQPTAPTFNTLYEKELCGCQVLLTIPALPYGRSATQAQIAFAAPVPVGPAIPPPPAPVVLDNYATIASTQCSQSSQCVIGPTTCCWDPDTFGDPGGQNTPLTYAATFPAPVNLVNMTAIQFWLGLGSRYYANLDYCGKTAGVGVYFTLTDTSGNTLAFSKTSLLLPVSQSAQLPVFTRISMHFPRNSATFNYASVAGYSIQIVNRSDRILRFSWVTAYLDTLTALPASQAVNPVVRGAVFSLTDLAGTARSPASLSFQQAPSPGTVTTVTTAGSGVYTVPANTAWLKVEAWGGGGSGAQMTSAGVGAGGGGSEYTCETVFPAAAGQSIPYIVGSGDTSPSTLVNGLSSVFGPGPSGTLQVIANGGMSAAANVAGAGGSGSLNGTEHPGGAGRANPAGTFGGGGGSSAGTAAAGNAPTGTGTVLFTTPGTFSGGSGWLCPAGVTAITVECWGAGGGAGSGGSGGANGNGGNGGGYAKTTNVAVTPGTHYAYTVGAGGAGGTGGGNGSSGGASSFTGNSVTVTGNPGAGGWGNSWYGSPGSGSSPAGGSGGSVYAGGLGGPSYPYTGGGGSSAGPGSSGNTASSTAGAIAPSGGGNGGNGSGNNNGAGSAGSAPGGGGGGSHTSSYAGGAGAAGQVRITYPASTGAPTNAGGVAVSGGGAGGAGGATAGSTGTAGSAPGGGGGGAWSSGAAVAGGAGAAGQIRITPYIPSAFKSLIVHRPPLGTLKTFQPLVSVGAGGDAPDGTHSYTMPQLVTGVNADFGGTYSVYLIASSWSGGSSSTVSRTIFVTVTQYEYAGGAGYSQSTLPVTVSPSQVTNGIVVAGVLTLPIKAVAPDNLGAYYTVSVTDSNTSDRFYDCIFLDTMGQLVVINRPTTGYVTYYVDAPDPNVSVGRVMGSQLGRPDAISVTDASTVISGGALYVEPADGDNMLFVYSADALAPNTSVNYFPCYYFDRTL